MAARSSVLQFLGATGTVTGSCFLIRTQESSVLVDCGLFQGTRELRRRNWAPFGVDPASIDAVVLTQALVHRALWVDQLARATWDAWRTTPHLAWTVEEALQRARDLAGPEDCICVTGSVFVVGAALQALGMEVR